MTLLTFSLEFSTSQEGSAFFFLVSRNALFWEFYLNENTFLWGKNVDFDKSAFSAWGISSKTPKSLCSESSLIQHPASLDSYNLKNVSHILKSKGTKPRRKPKAEGKQALGSQKRTAVKERETCWGHPGSCEQIPLLAGGTTGTDRYILALNCQLLVIVPNSFPPKFSPTFHLHSCPRQSLGLWDVGVL